MNKNLTALILIILAVGIYFTFTSKRIPELQGIRTVNLEYKKALNNADNLIKIRDKILKEYNAIPPIDIVDRLNKMVPDNMDNVRLIIDVKDDLARKRGLELKDIVTSSPEVKTETINRSPEQRPNTPEEFSQVAEKKYGEVTMSFSVTSSYQKMLDFLQDIESSLRLMDITKLSVTPGEDEEEKDMYNFSVEIKTYWLIQ